MKIKPLAHLVLAEPLMNSKGFSVLFLRLQLNLAYLNHARSIAPRRRLQSVSGDELPGPDRKRGASGSSL